MKELPPSLLLKCFFRTYFVGAAHNTRGLQNIGFLFAIEPGLKALYGQGEKLRDARMRYARHYNCHPFLTPMLLGAFLRMESAIAASKFSPQALVNLKDTTANTLSGIGDSFFSGSLLSTWALSMAILLCLGLPSVAVILTFVLFLMLQAFKFCTFIMGCTKGMAFLPFMRRLNLINWGERLKCLNAVLLVSFLWLVFPVARATFWGAAGLCLLVCAWLVGKLHMPRVVLAAALMVLIMSLGALGVLDALPMFFPDGCDALNLRTGGLRP